VELKHLQALLGIADTGSFSAAAASIGTVQSNVSAHVARLERELDVQLVDRASGRLTEEGDVVIERARRVMNELEAMVADVTALREEVIGTVRLGMIGTTGRWLVPQLFDLLRVRHPHIHLNVAEGSSMQLEQQLASGQLDLAVVTFPLSGDEIMAAQLFDEDLVAVLPADHPMSTETSIPLERLSELKLLVPARVALRPAMELDGVRLIASLAFDGYGPAILPATAVPGHLRGRFSVLPVAGLPRRRVGVAQRRRGLPSAPARSVIDVLGLVVNDALSMPEGIHPT
jgi:DNA-binding transcriptional LysR family regulator